MRYPIVFLDADNTLFDFSASQYESLREAMTRFSLPFSDEIAEIYDGINTDVWKRYEQGTLTHEGLFHLRFERLLTLLHADPDMADALNAAYEKLLETSSILLPGAEEFCRELAKECTLCILTNGAEAVQKSRLSLSPIRPYITRLFISQALGAQKPAKEFFEAVFAALGLQGDRRREAVMVGDSLPSDILGGLNAGLDTIWFNPRGLPPTGGIQPLYTARDYDEIKRLILGAD